MGSLGLKGDSEGKRYFQRLMDLGARMATCWKGRRALGRTTQSSRVSCHRCKLLAIDDILLLYSYHRPTHTDPDHRNRD